MQLWWQTQCELIHWNDTLEEIMLGKDKGKKTEQLIDELLEKKKNYTDLKKTAKDGTFGDQ